MADQIRMGFAIQKDKLGSPSTGSEDGGGLDLGEPLQEFDPDETDGPMMPNGNVFTNLIS